LKAKLGKQCVILPFRQCKGFIKPSACSIKNWKKSGKVGETLNAICTRLLYWKCKKIKRVKMPKLFSYPRS